MAKKKAAPQKKRGPKLETLRIEGNRKNAMKHALKRGKPPKRKAD